MGEGPARCRSSYEGDALFFAVVAKASAQDGLPHFERLGPPFGVEIVDWGAGMPFDLSALRVLVSRASASQGLR